jgi:hypothetical protein
MEIDKKVKQFIRQCPPSNGTHSYDLRELVVGLLDNSTKAGRNLEKLCVALRPCTDGAI